MIFCPLLVHLWQLEQLQQNCENWPVDVHEYLVWALGTQMQGHMLPLHSGKRCNHSEMIASSDIEDTDTSSWNTKWGFVKTFGQLHCSDYLSWEAQLPPRFVLCKSKMIKLCLNWIRLTLWSSPGQLSVTRRLGPGKESTFVSEPGQKNSWLEEKREAWFSSCQKWDWGLF